MGQFKDFCADLSAITSVQEKTIKANALAEQKNILFNCRDNKSLVEFETKLMKSKAKTLGDSDLEIMACEASRIDSVFIDNRLASVAIFNVFQTIHELHESMVGGDSDYDAEKIAKGETSGAITGDVKTVKKPTKSEIEAKKKQLKQVAEQLSESYRSNEPNISNSLAESKIITGAAIAKLYSMISKTNKSVIDINNTIKSNASGNASVISKLRKAKISGNTTEMLQILLGFAAYSLSGNTSDLAKRGKRKD